MEQNLIANIKSFLNSADTIYELKDYTSATTLYFKAVFVVFDYLILKATGKIPKDHTERFRILQQNFPELYVFLDKAFPIYKKTYSYTTDKETCDWVKNNVRDIIKKQKIPV